MKENKLGLRVPQSLQTFDFRCKLKKLNFFFDFFLLAFSCFKDAESEYDICFPVSVIVFMVYVLKNPLFVKRISKTQYKNILGGYSHTYYTPKTGNKSKL